VTAVLVVFARQPVPGRVKTRLAAGIGPARAAAVYDVLLLHTIETARSTSVETIVSFAEPPDPTWTPAPAPDAHEVQGQGDLGDRMGECFRRRFDEGADRVVIIGSDNPWFRSEHVHRAFAALDDEPVVLGPARDGGYWLVGQRAPGFDLFTGVPWSSRDTLDATRDRLRTLGILWRELETLADIDTASDLERALGDCRTPASLVAALRPLYPSANHPE
jgi:rSAM/selenodomain-associated transferase 1